MSKKNKSENSERVNFVEHLRTYSKTRNLYVLTIAKNCSTSLLDNLTPDFEQHQRPLKTADVIVILRDPYERWLSGTVEYFAITASEQYGTREHMLRMLDIWLRHTPHEFDYHTEPQSKSLEVIDQFSGNVYYYYQHSKVLDDINQDWNILERIEHNNTSEHRHRPKFRHALDKWVYKNKERLLKHLDVLYAEDYKLINSLQFVNWNVTAGS